jgi:hypothetical protein
MLKNFKSNNLIIAITIFFIVISFSFLAYAQTKQQDPNYGKAWWSLYFSTPKDNDLSFYIENHSGQENFHWEITLEKSVVTKGDSVVPLGEKKLIPVKNEGLDGKRVSIKVTAGKTSKEIYKDFK